MAKKHLAQINIAQMKAAKEDPIMKEFVDFLDPVNKLAEESPGFVWRLVGEPTEPSPWEDRVIINMSVWENLESLKNFTYQTAHSYFVKSRKKWFHLMDKPHYVLWWVDAERIPSLAEAAEKLALLDEVGPSADAFTFAKPFYLE
ncbi:MAG: DUF3291 domain-containing protein [Bacteroidota bacterium]